MSGKIYLDNNATTTLDPRVLEAMVAELSAGPANPSSIHSYGRAALGRLNKARELIAQYLGVSSKELIFTSSGTEALNLAILGIPQKGHILTSPIEHAAIYNTLSRLNQPVTHLPVGLEGHVKAADVEASIRPETKMIVLSAVNNETGVQNPIQEIGEIAERKNIPFVVDAVAALGKELMVISRGVSAMAFSAHKIHGPKGIGLLYVRKGCKLDPLLTGGGQEGMRRAGTENLPGIIGFAKAIELLRPEMFLHMQKCRDLLEASLSGIRINGSGPRVCNTSSITFPGMDGEGLLIKLDMAAVAASMGSACSSGALKPSHVLLGMGLSREEARSTLRFSLSRFNTEEEIAQVVQILRPLA